MSATKVSEAHRLAIQNLALQRQLFELQTQATSQRLDADSNRLGAELAKTYGLAEGDKVADDGTICRKPATSPPTKKRRPRKR